MDSIFWWIGYAAVALVVLATIGLAALWLWVAFIQDRFGAILFRKTERRLSIASWHATRMATRFNPTPREEDDTWPADDWPISERPFYVSYRIGQRRLFFMAGIMQPMRHRSIAGKHPTTTDRRK